MFRALYCLHSPFLTDCDPSSEQCKTNPDIPALKAEEAMFRNMGNNAHNKQDHHVAEVGYTT